MPSERKDPEECFHEALSKAEGAERSAYLDVACAGSPELRARVEALLAAHSAAEESFLPLPTTDRVWGSQDPIPEAPGGVVGPYKLLQQIGEGGFGVVFMAEQSVPVHRRVALKIIKHGMDTRQFIARFEAERQALAMMDHPNVARVFDAGATESGRPYFVMELVNGIPITEYCDRHVLGIERRLRLFTQVCYAVHHAHQKGLIHRDIKPGNVLVATVDDRPVVKVIDFGVAKATQGQLTEKTLFTLFRQLVGTPQYMSPEQADATPDIDTRADVYSLAVLLYQLLTGATPLDERALRSRAHGEIQRMIREVDPPPPSTRLSTLESIASVAACRAIEPRRLRMRLHGELDWIVMKAMEKDRAKRYDSAAAFAADIENHLASLPVRAGAPSRLLQLRKFVRRNRRPAALITAAVMTLAAGFVGTTIGLIGQSRLREQAERERDETQAQRRQAQANLAEALFNGGEFARAEAEFRALLRPPEHGPAATAEQEANWLGYIARSIDEQRRGMLRARADAAFLAWLESKGVAPTAAGGSVSPAMNGDEPPALEVVEQAYDAAIAALRRVYSPGDTRIADIVLRKAYALRDFGRPAEAEPLYREAMMSYLALTPPDHIANGEIIVALANDLWRLHRHQEAAALYDQAIAEYKLGPRDRQWRIGSARLYRAENLVALGRFSEAESDLGEVEQRFSGTGDGYQECAQGYAELYRAWDAAEPGRGHDEKARAWEMKILPNLSTFKKAITQPIERWPDK
jgi:serine/threonine protein kinase